jgi:hypothetical protein
MGTNPDNWVGTGHPKQDREASMAKQAIHACMLTSHGQWGERACERMSVCR